MTKAQARRIMDDLQRWERQTRQPGRQDGAIGRNGLAVVRALLFRFMNWQTGRCDPSQAAIAAEACISPKSVERGLAALKAAGVLNWLRRCVADVQSAGGFLMRQISSAYAVLPSSQWQGYRAPEGTGSSSSSRPEAGTWGDHPPADPYGEAKAAGDLQGRLAALDAEAAGGSGIAKVHADVLRRRLLATSASEAVRLTKKPDDRFILKTCSGRAAAGTASSQHRPLSHVPAQMSAAQDRGRPNRSRIAALSAAVSLPHWARA
jgi:hypothetical protein